MPRKTQGARFQAAGVDTASMRPRPDAAENPGGAVYWVQRLKVLQ